MAQDQEPKAWWQSVPAILTALTGTITAVAGLIAAWEHFGAGSREPPKEPPPQSAVIERADPAAPSGSSNAGAATLSELESRLKAVNIKLSTGNDDDLARVRSYFTGADSAYRLLAINCLEVMGDVRLRDTGYLDMIDKWYTALVGGGSYVTGSGKLDPQKLKEAMVKAQNDYYSQHAKSFQEIVEPSR